MIVPYARRRNEAQRWLRRLTATQQMKNQASQSIRYLLLDVPVCGNGNICGIYGHILNKLIKNTPGAPVIDCYNSVPGVFFHYFMFYTHTHTSICDFLGIILIFAHIYPQRSNFCLL